MGTIEIRAYRCHVLRTAEYLHNNIRLREGRVSERSKKAGWHHVRYYTSRAFSSNSHPYTVFVFSTADEAPSDPINTVVDCKMVDPQNAPYASVKVFYRPKGGPFHTFPAI